MESIIESLTQTIDRTKLVALKAKEPLHIYFEFFPNELKKGLVSFKSEKKDIKNAYFTCASALVNIISEIENVFSDIPRIMLWADRNAKTDIVCLCDELLDSYNRLRLDLGEFTSQSENILRSPAPSYSKLFGILSEFKTKFLSFIAYLESINI